MINFWLLALVLLACALLLLLWPVLKVRKTQAEEDRTALNVALYEERVAELHKQQEQGTLSVELFEQGRQEAERELLDDTAGAKSATSVHLGMALPLIASLLLPIVASGLYMVWGAGEQISLTQRLATDADSPEEMIDRLETLVRLQPDSVDGWFYLGRNYMGEQRPQDAAKAFVNAMDLVGRQPQILAQWAQAQYFANGEQWTPDLQDAVDAVLAANPLDTVTLGLVGIAGFESGNFDVAHEAWTRLLSGVNPADGSAGMIQTGIDRAAAAMEQFGRDNPNAVTGPVLPPLPQQAAAAADSKGQVQVEVTLAPELLDGLSADATVFVFARSEATGPLPLAARRLQVADLPARLVLSDADAVMSEARLSVASGVHVQASIALDGNASNPDWVSAEQAVVVDTEQAYSLQIDRASARQMD